MTKVAKRYLIGGAVGIAALLTALGLFAFKAVEKLGPASTEAKPAPVAAALALTPKPESEEAAPKAEAPPSAPAADLANAFGAALGVEVKDAPKKSGASTSAPSNPGQASSPSPQDPLTIWRSNLMAPSWLGVITSTARARFQAD